MKSSRPTRWLATAALTTMLGAPYASLHAQQPASPPVETGPKVGEMAPDFSLPGATRYGVLKDHVKLADYRGNTVVLAFFFKARTKG